MRPKNLGRYSSSRDNTFTVVAFIKVLYPVKYAIFLAKEGLYTLMASYALLFYQFFNEENIVVM